MKQPVTHEKAQWDRIRALGCLVCGRAAQIHHVTAYADRMGRFSRSHQLVVPLCANHHQAVFDNVSDPQSVEILGHRGFYEKHGIDLHAKAKELWDE